MRNVWANAKRAFYRALDGAKESSPEDASNSPDGIIQSGDFIIDLARRSASLRGRPLALSPEEFDLLVFLAGHPRSLITPRTVLASGWGQHPVRRTELWKALLSLRGKLNAVAGPGRQYLRTEPWVAYRFDSGSSLAP